MRHNIYTMTERGYSDVEIKSGTILPPDHDVEYEPTLTDQSYNISIQSQVENFVASGKLISAMHQGDNVEIPIDNRLDSFYGDDLPDITQRIYAFNEKQKALEEEQKRLDEERKKFEEILKRAKEGSSKETDA